MKTERARSFSSEIWGWTKSIVIGFAFFLVIRAFLIQTWVITSGSMEGTLLVGDLLILNKVAYGASVPGTQLPSARLQRPTARRRGCFSRPARHARCH